jgi:hypothetical protein
MDVNGQLHGPAALTPGKQPLYPLDRRLGGPQNRYGRVPKKKKFLPLPEVELRLYAVDNTNRIKIRTKNKVYINNKETNRGLRIFVGW